MPSQPAPAALADTDARDTDARARWALRGVAREEVSALVRALGVDELTALLLLGRGHKDHAAAREHLHPELKRLHDPFLLPGMRAATERIARALERGETILVHGDYDVDGVTGTALLVRLFRLLGARAEWHIPSRLVDGYSFGPHSVERARAVGATLVISVDNGTSAARTIAELAAHGIDTIVTDHHEPPQGELPRAAAIVNPKLDGARYPFRELCGGAVAFKLAWGICQDVTGEARVRDDLRAFLIDAMSYVAIATVCDVVPLVGENRILARYGLKALSATRDHGLSALLAVARLSGRLCAEDVGYQIGPRINASGRLGTAHSAVELLLARDPGAALALARELDDLNHERRAIERTLFEQALEAARPFADPGRFPVLVVAGEGWHQGVVGIVAARLVERFGRPALVVGLDGETGRGSARSVPGFSILDAMHGGAEHMLRYGGHAQAAGCEIRADRVDALRDAVCARAREQLAETPLPARELRIDARVPLARMNPTTMGLIERLEPFGERNEKPVLLASDVRLGEEPRLVGREDAHLLLRLRSGECVHKAMGFGLGGRASELRMGAPLHVVYTPRWNTFRGETRLELELLDFRVGECPV